MANIFGYFSLFIICRVSSGPSLKSRAIKCAAYRWILSKSDRNVHGGLDFAVFGQLEKLGACLGVSAVRADSLFYLRKKPSQWFPAMQNRATTLKQPTGRTGRHTLNLTLQIIIGVPHEGRTTEILVYRCMEDY